MINMSDNTEIADVFHEENIWLRIYEKAAEPTTKETAQNAPKNAKRSKFAENKTMRVHFAPLQGYTDAIYRATHAEIWEGTDQYYTPFVRIEDGEIRKRDLRDLRAEINAPLKESGRLTVQLMAGNAEEVQQLTEVVAKEGYTHIDLNMGCPFPLLTKKHKGAGILPYPEEVAAQLHAIEAYPDLHFSLKMRLGLHDAQENEALLPLINDSPLEQVAVHARLGEQQYKGTTNQNAFDLFYEKCQKPLVYNGDLTTRQQALNMLQNHERLQGLMIGRGLLAQPWLAQEIQKGESVAKAEAEQKMYCFHELLYNRYQAHLEGGEHQLLDKMKTLWDYLLPDLEKKDLKKIVKSKDLDSYQANVGAALGKYFQG